MSRYTPVTPSGTPWGDAFLIALMLANPDRIMETIGFRAFDRLVEEYHVACVMAGVRGAQA
jgi:hypothetical protein